MGFARYRFEDTIRFLWRIAPFRRLDPIRKVIVIGTASIALMLGVACTVAVRRYHIELADAARELRTLDLLLAAETERSMQSVSLVLESTADDILRRGVASAADLASLEATRAVHDELRARVAGIPQLDAISIVGADGQLINFSRYWPVPDVRLADREYFQFIRDHAVPAPYLSEPVINRGSGTPTIYLARRLSAPDGTFLGILAGAIELSYLQRLYDSLHLAPGNTIGLWRSDGTLLARYPPGNVGQRKPLDAILPTAAAVFGVPGVSEKSGDPDGAPSRLSVVASEKVAGYPLQINIGRQKSIVLQDWRREATAVSLFIMVAIVCILVMMWALMRRFAAYEAVALAARERERAILARQEAEDALRQAQKMEAVGQLTGGVAHDFNNLLTVIGSSVELLRRDNVEPERRARYVEAIGDASQRAAKLTGQLLAFARRQALKPEVFDVVENVSMISQMIDRLTGARIDMAIDLPDQPLYVDADANQFDTAVVNLAVNARDAMPDGGRLRIVVRGMDELPATSTSARREGTFVSIAVSDSGGGIAPELRDRVFEPFFTTKQAGQGTGLGLSQVIGFAKQSGGEVSLESELGRGSTFTLHLPRVVADVERSRPRVAVGIAADGKGARVLVVDDDPDVARLTADMLRELRYFSVTATSAEEALAVVAQDPDGYDVVLSDVVMPGMDGLALAREVGRRFPRLPVALVTGFSATLAEQGAGAYTLLHKPYDLSGLSATLRTAMAGEGRTDGDIPAEGSRQSEEPSEPAGVR